MTRKIPVLQAIRVAVLVGLVLGLSGVDVACSSGSCDGVVIDGKCEQRCQDSACVKGTRCIVDDSLNNFCSKACKTQTDCPVGQNCVGYKFPDNSQGNYCVRLPYTKGGHTGEYEACQSDKQCDTLRDFRCVAGKCQVPCTSSVNCGAIGVCQPGGKDASGKTVNVCVPDQKPRAPGQFGTACLNGQSDCDTKSDFTCMGPKGATDSYCTLADCTSDADCPSDYFCALLRVGTPPCQDTCGMKGDSSGTCAKASDIGPGKKYQCGPLNLRQHICIKRSFCDECQTDADCSAKPNQVCASDGLGHKYCTIPCDPATNSCPWGTAAACGHWDKTLSFDTCRHRFGACKGTGQACEPCVDNSDCSSNGLCAVDSFTNEHFCVNLSDTCSCPAGSTSRENPSCNGGGCPDTPGGLKGSCLGDPSAQTDPTTGGPNALYDHCIGADVNANVIGGTPQTGCWPH